MSGRPKSAFESRALNHEQCSQSERWAKARSMVPPDEDMFDTSQMWDGATGFVSLRQVRFSSHSVVDVFIAHCIGVISFTGGAAGFVSLHQVELSTLTAVQMMIVLSVCRITGPCTRLRARGRAKTAPGSGGSSTPQETAS
jgi:hypothetical protein